jgi:hypothetical protein
MCPSGVTNLKIPKGYSEAMNLIKTVNTITNKNGQKYKQ